MFPHSFFIIKNLEEIKIIKNFKKIKYQGTMFGISDFESWKRQYGVLFGLQSW
jgi:hypothetical protein